MLENCVYRMCLAIGIETGQTQSVRLVRIWSNYGSYCQALVLHLLCQKAITSLFIVCLLLESESCLSLCIQFIKYFCLSFFPHV